MTIAAQHRSIEQIQRDIASIRYAQKRPQDLPSMEPIERRMGTLAARHAIDPSDGNIKADLHEAGQALEQAKEIWRAHMQSNTDIRNLEIELNDAQHAARAEVVAIAEGNLNQAISEYKHAALTAARAYRTLINQRHNSSAATGMSYNLSDLYLEKFNIGHLVPASWQGSLGSVMMMGTAPFEAPAPKQQYSDLKAA